MSDNFDAGDIIINDAGGIINVPSFKSMHNDDGDMNMKTNKASHLNDSKHDNVDDKSQEPSSDEAETVQTKHETVQTKRARAVAEQLIKQLESNPNGFPFTSSLLQITGNPKYENLAFNHLHLSLQEKGYGMYVKLPAKFSRSTYYPRLLPDVIQIRRLPLMYDANTPWKRLRLRMNPVHVALLTQTSLKLQQSISECERWKSDTFQKPLEILEMQCQQVNSELYYWLQFDEVPSDM